jgi:nucleotide-binding universal stress UspA family protein
MIALKRILLATDFSETSAVALRYARALAEQFQASLGVLHVLEDPLVGYVSECPTPTFAEIRRNMEADAREHLDTLFTEVERSRLHVQLLTKWGSPFVEIVRVARESGIDLIVIGTHGRGPVKHMLLGSVAEKVVRNSPCPVLTVRHPEHEFVMP